MKVRLCQILKDLSNYNNNTIMDLCDRYHVSKRTIRNDIKKINDFLKENNQSLIRVSRAGRIAWDVEITTLKDILNSLDLYKYKLSYIERRLLLSYILLMSKPAAKVKDLAAFLRVSRSTINYDIESLKKEFSNYGLAIDAYSNKGIYVVGTEEQKREFLLYIKAFDLVLRDHLLTHIDREYFDVGEDFIIKNRSLVKIIKKQLEHFDFKLSDFYLDHVVDYCELLVRRNKENNYIEKTDETISGYGKINSFTESVYNLLIQYYKIEHSKSEVRALSKFIRNIPLNNEVNESEYSVQIQILTRKFIEKISEDINTDLSDDFDFYESLSKHLDLIQEEELFIESSPFIEQIVGSNTEVLKAVRTNIHEYENFIKRKLSKIEIYYIVIHICAALERKYRQKLNIEAVLVCNSEIGSLKLLKEKLKSHFDFKSIKIQDKYSLNPKKNTIVLTTVPFSSLDIDYIKVSPFLTDEDLIQIGRRIERIRSEGNRFYNSQLNSVSSSKQLIKHINQIILTEPDVYKTMDQVDQLLSNYFKIPDSSNPSLHELLSVENMIELEVEVKDLESGIRHAGNLLKKEGIVDEAYIESCLEAARLFSPCLFVKEEFLLPHYDAGSGNKKVGFSLIRLKKPITISNGRSVRWISMMSAVNRTDHLKALFVLTNLIQDSDYMNLLEKAQTPDKVFEIIKRYEYLEHPTSVY